MSLRSNYLEINEKEKEENGADLFKSVRQPNSNHQGLQGSRQLYDVQMQMSSA